MKRTPISAAIAAIVLLGMSGLYAQTIAPGTATGTQSGRSGANAMATTSTSTGAAVPGSTAADRTNPGAMNSGTSMRSSNSASSLNRGDRKFVDAAAKGGMMEVELGRVAADKASDPAVKQFGERMVRDHGEANKKLMDVAQAKGMTPSAKLKSSDQRMLDKLSRMSGNQFDRAYMDDMVRDHKKDISDFQKEAKSGKDAELKRFAEDTLPVLQEHLKMAQDTQSKVKGGGGSAATRSGTTSGSGMTSGASPSGASASGAGSSTTTMPSKAAPK